MPIWANVTSTSNITITTSPKLGTYMSTHPDKWHHLNNDTLTYVPLTGTAPQQPSCNHDKINLHNYNQIEHKHKKQWQINLHQTEIISLAMDLETWPLHTGDKLHNDCIALPIGKSNLPKFLPHLSCQTHPTTIMLTRMTEAWIFSW